MVGILCYKYFELEKTRIGAIKQCSREGGHIASIHSKEENYFILALLPPNTRLPWIGGYLITGGTWAWLDGSEFSFDNLATGEPRQSLCRVLIINKDHEDYLPGKWLSKICSGSVKRSYVCKMSK